jgi:hypothetical protein
MSNLDQAIQRIEELQAEADRAKDAYSKALAKTHDAIRELLTTGPRGAQKALVERGRYSRPHLDRIRRGKTSG